MRIAVIGATGQLGQDVVKVARMREAEVVALGHDEVDITNVESVRRALLSPAPDVVVNCAAYVRVDDCEDRAGEAFEVNALGALHVARFAAEGGASCVYVSTDYVFDGAKDGPYTEDDLPRPVNVYGVSKLAGEFLTQQACSDWLIVRVASLFGKAGARGKGSNFVETILQKAASGERLRVVDDVWMSPTYTVDAARALYQLLADNARGIFHLAGRGRTTWYRFAQTALRLAGLETPIDPTPSADFPSRAIRPKNSAVTATRTGSYLKELRPWEAGLADYLAETGKRRPVA